MERERTKYNHTLIQSIFKEKTNNTLLQLFRYTFVGGFAFLVDFGTLFFLTEFFHIHYLVSAGIAFLFGLTINYFFKCAMGLQLQNNGKPITGILSVCAYRACWFRLN